jgi:two-component system cell cycle sensor histidine kinase/response regulator CckA
MVVGELVSNLALLLALGVLYSLLVRRPWRDSLQGKILIGLLFGGMCFTVMLNPMTLLPGVIFDTRSVVLSLAGLFGGPLVAGIAVAIGGGLRIWLGGAGTLAGVAGIIWVGAVGLVYHRMIRGDTGALTPFKIYLFGLVVQAGHVATIILLPGDIIWIAFKKMALPMMLVLPVGITILGILLSDVRSRLDAEMKLKASEKRYRKLFEANPMWTTVTSRADGRFLEANPAFFKTTGYDPQKTLGRLSAEVGLWIDPAEREQVMSELESRGSLEGRPIRFKMKDGEFRDFLWYATPIMTNSEPVSISVLVDITERNKAEQELSAIFSMSLDLICIADINTGTFLRVNPAFTETLGRPEEELLGKPFYEFIHPDDIEITQSVVEDQLRQGSKVLGFENRYQHKDGSYRWLSWVSHPIPAQGKTFAVARDITDWKRANQQLERNKMLLDETSRIARIGGWELDAETLEVSWTEETYRIHEVPIGYKPPLQEALDFYHPDDRPILAQAVQDALDHGKPYDMEVRFTSAKGNQLWTRTICEPELRDGKVVRLRGIFHDITPQKQAEEVLRRDLRRQEIAMELAKLVHWEYDVTTDSFTFDDQFYALYGTSVSEQGGTRMTSAEYAQRFLPPEEVPVVANEIKVAMESTDPNLIRQLEHRIIRADGQERYISVQFGIVQDEAGRTIKTFGANQDITERKRSEEELRKRNRFIETILENMPIGLAVNSIADGKATYVNRKFEEIYGWPKEEMENVADFFEKVYPDPEYRNALMQRIMADMQSGDPKRMAWEDIEVTGQDGSKRIVFAKNIPLPEQNLMISTVQDVTERKQLETQLAHAQKMEAIGTLAGGIAHDFNNLLGAILGYTEIAHGDALHGGKASPEDLEQILTAANRAKSLVKQILSFSRKDELHFKPIDLNRIVLNTREILLRVLPKMIEIKTDLADDLPAIQGDSNHIEHVLLNLASNAKDAMPEGGRLIFRTRTAMIKKEDLKRRLEMDPGQYVLLEVEDSGLGMDSKTLARVFEPFFTTKDVGSGTGLGLASAFGIVKSHEGHIHCHSQEGLGTTFAIYLPAHELESQDLKAEPDSFEASELTGTETILLVDDEKALLHIGSRTLGRMGYEVLTAGSGEEALEKYKAAGSSIDLVVMDLGMPGMGGIKALKALKEIDLQVKVLIASGYAADEQVRDALASGASGYVAKPFVQADLLAAVRTVLHQN